MSKLLTNAQGKVLLSNNKVFLSSGGGEIIGQTKTVTENGTVTPDTGYNALTRVDVNVPTQGETITVTNNTSSNIVTDDKVWVNKSGNNFSAIDFYVTSYNNFNKFGEIDVNSSTGVVTGFSSTNYLTCPAYDLREADSWEMYAKFNMSTGSRYQFFYHGQVAFGLDNSNKMHIWGVPTEMVSTYTFSTDVDYWVKLEFTGTQYLAYYKTAQYDEWTTIITVNSSTKKGTTSSPTYIGINPNTSSEYFYGTLYLSDYLIKVDGEVFWSPLKNDVNPLITEDTITGEATQNIAINATGSVMVGDVISSNITSLSITPTTSQQNISATGNVNGYSPITVAAVTSNIDNNITAGNIKDGVTILGVTGNYNGSGATGYKYGAGGDTFLGDTNSSGVLQKATASGITNLSFTGATNIGYQALQSRFSNMPTIGTVSFPDLETITNSYSCQYAFQNCAYITSVSMPKLETVTSNGYTMNAMFSGCTRLASINLGSLTSITGNDALREMFYGCTSLTSVDLSSLTRVCCQQGCTSMFEGCTNLSSVDLSGLTNLGQWQCCYRMFANCTSLESVSFDNLSVMNDGNGEGVLRQAFANCTSLETLYFPSVTANSFTGEFQTQFSNMLSGCSGVTVHFPYTLETTLENWPDVVDGFGGTDTVVLYDINAGTVVFTTPSLVDVYLSAANKRYTNVAEYSNFKSFGDIVVNQTTGDATNFGATNYLQLPNSYTSSTETKETKICFTTGSDVSTLQNLFYGTQDDNSCSINIQNNDICICNKRSWLGPQYTYAGFTLQTNTKYYLKLSENSSGYITPSLSTDDVNYTSGTQIRRSYTFGKNICLGVYNDSPTTSFYGTIHLADCYIKIGTDIVWTALVHDTSNSLTVYTAPGSLDYYIYYPTTSIIDFHTVTGILENSTTNVTVTEPQTYYPLTITISNDPGINNLTIRVGNITIPLTKSNNSFTINTANSTGYQLTYEIEGTSTTLKTTGTITLTGSTQSAVITPVQRQTENFTVIGSPVISSGYIINGFSTSDYLISTEEFSPGDNTWTAYTKVKTGAVESLEKSCYELYQETYGFRVELTTNNRFGLLVMNSTPSWINSSSYYGSYTPLSNTIYWLRAGYNGTQYYLDYSLDGETYTRDVQYTSSVKIGGGHLFNIGASATATYNKPWDGDIYLEDTYIEINGSEWWRAVETSS